MKCFVVVTEKRECNGSYEVHICWGDEGESQVTWAAMGGRREFRVVNILAGICNFGWELGKVPTAMKKEVPWVNGRRWKVGKFPPFTTVWLSIHHPGEGERNLER